MDVQNPIMKFRSYNIKNILVAFTTTTDAVNTKIDYSIGKCGDIISGTGCSQKGVVIVNEFVDNTYIIYLHENEFSFHSFFDHSTSSMTGSITIVDSVGGHFQNFMRDKVAAKLDISQTHIIFALKTYIVGTTYDEKTEVIAVKPLIFHMYNLTHSFDSEKIAQNMYSILYVADYNTFALLPNYSKMFQMTITHKDSGGLPDDIVPQLYNNIPPTNLPNIPTQPVPSPPTVTPTPTVTVTPPADGVFKPASSFSISQGGIDLIKRHIMTLILMLSDMHIKRMSMLVMLSQPIRPNSF
jgi:hypothetical protein